MTLKDIADTADVILIIFLISSEFSPSNPRRASQVNFDLYIQYLFTDAENRSAVALFPLKLSWANSFPIMGPLCPYLTSLYLNYVPQPLPLVFP